MERNKDIDGGYAWLVMVAAFSVMFFVGMLAYSAGVVNSALLDEIDGDISRTSWIGATLLGTFTMAGPLAGFLTKIFGCRVSCFCGGILVLIGLGAASLVNSFVGLILTYGIVTGIGMGMALNSSAVVPGHYFRLKRGVAFGIVSSGAGFGMFAGGPLIRYLVEEYRIHGCFLIFGAIECNICVAACILRPSTTETKKVSNVDLTSRTETVDGVPRLHEEECHLGTNLDDDGDDCIQCENTERGTVYEKCGENFNNEAGSLLRADNSSQYKEERVVVPEDFQIHDENSCPEQSNGCMRIRCFEKLKCSKPSFQSLLRKTRRKKIINKYGFLCYNISVLLWTMGETACMFHLPNYAEQKGSSKTQAASLFTAMGLTSIISRILAGFAGNDSSIGPLLVYIGLTGLEGMVTIFFPLFSSTYAQQMVFSAVFGLYSGGSNSLMCLLTIELVGLNNLSVGLGVEHFCCGIGFFLGPPLASLVYTTSKRYDYTFVFAGVLLILAAFFGLMTGFCGKKSQAPPRADTSREADIKVPDIDIE